MCERCSPIMCGLPGNGRDAPNGEIVGPGSGRQGRDPETTFDAWMRPVGGPRLRRIGRGITAFDGCAARVRPGGAGRGHGAAGPLRPAPYPLQLPTIAAAPPGGAGEITAIWPTCPFPGFGRPRRRPAGNVRRGARRDGEHAGPSTGMPAATGRATDETARRACIRAVRWRRPRPASDAIRAHISAPRCSAVPPDHPASRSRSVPVDELF